MAAYGQDGVREMSMATPAEAPSPSSSSNHQSFSFLFSPFHLAVAALAVSYVVVFSRHRTSADFLCLFFLSSIALAWGFALRRSWTVISLIASIGSLLLMTQCEHLFPSHSPVPRGPHDINLEWIFARLVTYLVFGCCALLEFVSLLYLLHYLSEWRRATHPLMNWLLRGSEWAFLGIALLLVYFGDLRWPRIAEQNQKERQAAAEARREQEKLLEIQHDEEIRGRLKKAIADLRVAATAGNQKEADSAFAVIFELFYLFGDGDHDRQMNLELQNSGSASIALVLDKLITGHFELDDFYKAVSLLETVEQLELEGSARAHAELARRRFTIAKMYRKSFLGETMLGSLDGERDAKAVIRWLIDAIGDREHSTPRERIDLAHALEEAAELGKFDARPAIKILQEIVDGDDEQAVKEAATSALAKAKLDRE